MCLRSLCTEPCSQNPAHCNYWTRTKILQIFCRREIDSRTPFDGVLLQRKEENCTKSYIVVNKSTVSRIFDKDTSFTLGAPSFKNHSLLTSDCKNWKMDGKLRKGRPKVPRYKVLENISYFIRPRRHRK
jgi:hypothetical protein